MLNISSPTELDRSWETSVLASFDPQELSPINTSVRSKADSMLRLTIHESNHIEFWPMKSWLLYPKEESFKTNGCRSQCYTVTRKKNADRENVLQSPIEDRSRFPPRSSPFLLSPPATTRQPLLQGYSYQQS